MNVWKVVSGKEKLTGRQLLLLAVFLIIAVLILSTWSVGYTARSEFCVTCHEMDHEYQTWLSSSHKNIACVDCHSGPGFQGLVKEKAKGMKEVYLHVTGNYGPIQADASEIYCYSCHQDKVKTDTARTAVAKNPHTIKHFDNGMNCLTCHSGIVHNEKLNLVLPNRESCATCHLDQMRK